MPGDDRDRQLDRALARRLSDSRDAACPDPEILAAYHERTLSLEEMAEWKRHIASCSRCQEALVLLEESEKALAEDSLEQEVEHDLGEAQALASRDAHTESLPFGHLMLGRAAHRALGASAPMPLERGSRLNWRWVAPVGALAAAVIVWIGVRDMEVANKRAEQGVQMVQNREAPPPVETSAPPPPAPKAPPPKESAPKAEVAPNPANRNPAPTVLESDKKPQVMPQAAPSEQEGPFAREDRLSGEAKAGAKESTAILAQSEMKKRRAAGAAPAPSTPVRDAAGLQANEPAATDKLEPLPPSAAGSAAVTAAVPALDSSQSDLRVMGRDSKDLLRLAAADHRLIVAPGQKHVWRVGEGGSISRSTDGGKTWKKQTSGVTVDLTSGSATSDKIAWVAGKSGTLLLTADGGKHWKQIPTPITGDLGGVQAVDETHASIWDVAHRKSFLTSDGGETWKPAANE